MSAAVDAAPQPAGAPPPPTAPTTKAAPPPVGRATSGFFGAVDSIRAFLRDEATADGWSDGGEAGGDGAGGGADAGAPAAPGRPSAGTARPPPDWDWVAGQLLPLLQQYSGEG